MAKCINENRILITLDLDFSDIRTYPPQNIPGCIVLRPHRQSKKRVINIIERIIPYINKEKLEKHLWVVDENRIRILNLMLNAELCVCEIETILEMTQSNASRHLAKLKSAGIITSSKEKKSFRHCVFLLICNIFYFLFHYV